MDERRHVAAPLPVDCPICNEEVEGDLEDHLLGSHTKREVIDELLAYVEAADQGSR